MWGFARRLRSNNGEASVADTAAVLSVPEFEVFRLAYLNWFGRRAPDEELCATFDRYLDTAVIPLWVRDFTRKVLRLSREGRLDLSQFSGHSERLPQAATRYGGIGGILVGGFVCMLLAAIVVLLVRLAILAQEANALQCLLPPCY